MPISYISVIFFYKLRKYFNTKVYPTIFIFSVSKVCSLEYLITPLIPSLVRLSQEVPYLVSKVGLEGSLAQMNDEPEILLPQLPEERRLEICTVMSDFNI